MVSKPFEVSIEIDTKIIQNRAAENIDLLKRLPEISHIFLSGNQFEFLNRLPAPLPLKFVPILSTLSNSSKYLKEPEISQIDATGSAISPYLCPNNLKVESYVKTELTSLNNYANIAGIQLEGLEMPSILSNPGCFCSFCLAIAADQGLDLKAISHSFIQMKNLESDKVWGQKNFIDWYRFRMQSITDFAGKLMVLLRRINPNLFLGLNLKFSETPEFLGQDYFFLALYLDLLNFIVNPPNPQGKGFLHQMKSIKSVTKKFLGQIRVFLQISVPDEAELNEIKTWLRMIRNNSFDGVILHIPSLDRLKKLERLTSLHV
ncbi:MAG: hypothetical protein LUQ65_01185 [Candidatus Helarchaeota archaeon]|nr:hypothetical protein [Candidatus Helarchaeota archaeon]